MLKFEGGVGSSRYPSPGVLGLDLFFAIGRFTWLGCVSDARYRCNGLKVRVSLNDINSKMSNKQKFGNVHLNNHVTVTDATLVTSVMIFVTRGKLSKDCSKAC